MGAESSVPEKLIVASSPVELEAEAAAAGLDAERLEAAVSLFHALTDRLAQAAIAREGAHEDWPNRRFYCGEPGPALAALRDGLRRREDLVEADGAPGDRAGAAPPQGLWVEARSGGLAAILVGHRDHAGLRAED